MALGIAFMTLVFQGFLDMLEVYGLGFRGPSLFGGSVQVGFGASKLWGSERAQQSRSFTEKLPISNSKVCHFSKTRFWALPPLSNS